VKTLVSEPQHLAVSSAKGGEQTLAWRGVRRMSEQTVDQRLSALEKEIAKLKVQVSARPAQEQFEEVLRRFRNSTTRIPFSPLGTPSTSGGNPQEL